MADSVLLNELHLGIRVPTDLDDAACDALKRILESRRFRTKLRRTVRELVRQYPERTPLRVRISV